MRAAIVALGAPAARKPRRPSPPRRGVAAASKKGWSPPAAHARAPKPIDQRGPTRVAAAAGKLLDELGGDVDAAQAARFDSYMEKLRASDPAAYTDVARALSADPGRPARRSRRRSR